MSIDRTPVNNYIHLIVIVFVRRRCRRRRREDTQVGDGEQADVEAEVSLRDVRVNGPDLHQRSASSTSSPMPLDFSL